jgi:hypothetical protein
MATQWQIAFRGTIGAQAGVAGAGIAWYLLSRKSSGWAYPVFFWFSPGISGQVNIIPYTSEPFFDFSAETDDPSDFSCFGSLLFRRGALAVGGFEHWLNFYSVNHSPNPIYLRGVLDIGVGVGAGWMPGLYECFSSLQIRTDDVVTKPLSLVDSDELSEVIADATDSLPESNTDPAWAA